jgi:hypothetical protein
VAVLNDPWWQKSVRTFWGDSALCVRESVRHQMVFAAELHGDEFLKGAFRTSDVHTINLSNNLLKAQVCRCRGWTD